jgi:hypothetical protein
VPEDSADTERVGLTPTNGYSNAHNLQSREGLLFLRWYKHSQSLKQGFDIPLQTAESPNGEFTVPGVGKVDGYYTDKQGREVIVEYNGCVSYL